MRPVLGAPLAPLGPRPLRRSRRCRTTALARCERLRGARETPARDDRQASQVPGLDFSAAGLGPDRAVAHLLGLPRECRVTRKEHSASASSPLATRVLEPREKEQPERVWAPPEYWSACAG